MKRNDRSAHRARRLRTWPIVAGGILLLAGCGSGGPTTDPAPISANSPFHYPIRLWDQGTEGETVLMVHVTDMGAVDTAYVQRSSGHAAFDSSALAGVPSLLFSPARKGRGGERVARWVRLPVRFTLDGGPGPATALPPDTTPAATPSS
ncbi:MAG TPA: energy transducer TonB [Longimicrobiales bacterium]|nr:energy transducer TonB [Longimicrobiales bacterium]